MRAAAASALGAGVGLWTWYVQYWVAVVVVDEVSRLEALLLVHAMKTFLLSLLHGIRFLRN